MNLSSFFAELKRRNVYKVAAAYAVIGWLLVQVATQVFPFFEIPNWAVRLVVLAIVIGFPVALVIAWAFELTPQGLKRTEDVDLAAQGSRKSHAWIYIVIVGAAFSIGLIFIGRYTARNTVSAARTETATGSSIPQKSIAVLPFENLSDDKGAAYFADGIQDEILTKLASIADLKVISRTSTARYKSKPEDLRTVSQQLGVANVLEGSVQKAADKVRINVQLIDAQADSHLWAKTYDRDIKDVFAVESEVAQEIADSLQAKLSPAEANTLATAPTKDTAAYDLFLKGESQLRAANASLRPESFDQAIAWYQQAIARDPNFALAMARLAESRLSQHWFVETFTEPELAEVKRTAEHALALAPDLAQAHVAHGLFYYYGYRQYEEALAEFGRALQLQPNNAQALEYSGYVYRRQGQWLRCLDTLKKSLEQDPRNADVAGNLAQTYCILRMWQDAERGGKYALNIDPADVIGMRALAPGDSERERRHQKSARRAGDLSLRERSYLVVRFRYRCKRDWRPRVYLCFRARFRSSPEGLGHQCRYCRGSTQTALRESYHSRSGRRFHRRTSRRRKSETTARGKITRAAERARINERIDLGLSRAQT